MFPKVSFVMILVSGCLLLVASLVNFLSGNPINLWLIEAGAVFVLIGSAVLLFSRKNKG
jgi:hypothetical protein